MKHRFAIESWSVLEDFLRHRPEAIYKVTCRRESQDRLNKLLAAQGLDQDIAIELSERTAIHAEVGIRTLDQNEFLERAADREQSLIVVVDHITDPRNLGAIVRSASFFGVREVVMANRRQAPLTQAVVDTSQGGLATCDLVVVPNIGEVLRRLKKADYWVVGTTVDGRPIAEAAKLDRCVVIFGNEESGLTPLVEKNCDLTVGIPSRGGVQSLNVSVAAGIVLDRLTDSSPS